MGKKFKWDMFVTSFIPLWISIIVISIWNIASYLYNSELKVINSESLSQIFNDNVISLILIFVILVLVITSMISISKLIKKKNKIKNKEKCIIKRARKANKLTSEFLLAYILPMIAFDYSELKYILLFIIYFFVLAFLCIRNNNIYTNIYLEFKGYRMYTCDVECTLMGKKHIFYDSLFIASIDLTMMVNNEIEYWDFDNYIYINLTGDNIYE